MKGGGVWEILEVFLAWAGEIKDGEQPVQMGLTRSVLGDMFVC